MTSQCGLRPTPPTFNHALVWPSIKIQIRQGRKEHAWLLMDWTWGTEWRFCSYSNGASFNLPAIYFHEKICSYIYGNKGALRGKTCLFSQSLCGWIFTGWEPVRVLTLPQRSTTATYPLFAYAPPIIHMSILPMPTLKNLITAAQVLQQWKS